MSLLRRVLNGYLRRTERPLLERQTDPARLRASFERKARLLFRPPFGARRKPVTLADRPALEVSCGPHDDCALLYFHGGAYVFGSPSSHWAMIARLCKYAQIRAFLPDYRKAPESLHPAALEDARAAYLELPAQGVDPHRTLFGGDSAGGGLALALLADLIARGHPLPAGCFAFSPLTDLSFSGASVVANADRDVVLPVSRVADMAEMFMGTQDRRDPQASPLFAQFEGAPPVWIVASDTEILRDDSRRMVAHLRAAGVAVAYTEEHDLPHVWPILQTLFPPARSTLRDLAGWIRAQVPQ